MSSGSTSPATPSPATRSSAASSGSTRATRSTRSRSSAARTASRASASSRTSSRSSRPRARRPDRVVLGVERRGKADRPAVAVGRLFEPRAVRHPARGLAEQLHGQGPVSSTPRSTGRAIRKSVAARLRRSLFPRQADPVRRPAVPPRLQQLQLSSATTATRPTRRSAPAAACGLGFPLTEYWNFGGALQPDPGQGLARQEHLLYRSRRHRPADVAVRPAQGRPLSVRRNRHPADLVGRLFDSSTTTPTASTRRAASG